MLTASTIHSVGALKKWELHLMMAQPMEVQLMVVQPMVVHFHCILVVHQEVSDSKRQMAVPMAEGSQRSSLSSVRNQKSHFQTLEQWNQKMAGWSFAFVQVLYNISIEANRLNRHLIITVSLNLLSTRRRQSGEVWVRVNAPEAPTGAKRSNWKA